MRLERKIYETKEEKSRDFWTGVGICFAANGIPASVLIIGLMALRSANWEVFSTVVGVLALLLNVGGLIYFGFTRKWIALGGLVALGIPLLLGLCLVAVCFSMVENW